MSRDFFHIAVIFFESQKGNGVQQRTDRQTKQFEGFKKKKKKALSACGVRERFGQKEADDKNFQGR